jgi:hypothetical protein
VRKERSPITNVHGFELINERSRSGSKANYVVMAMCDVLSKRLKDELLFKGLDDFKFAKRMGDEL